MCLFSTNQFKASFFFRMDGLFAFAASWSRVSCALCKHCLRLFSFACFVFGTLLYCTESELIIKPSRYIAFATVQQIHMFNIVYTCVCVDILTISDLSFSSLLFDLAIITKTISVFFKAFVCRCLN